MPPRPGYTAFYYDYGASVSEVEVDCLTGEYRILRADLLEDAGRALNPALDLSQVQPCRSFEVEGWARGCVFDS